MNIPTGSVTQPHQGLTTQFDPFLTAGQQKLREGYNRLKAEADRRGFSPASVINMHAFSWPVTGPVYPTNIDMQPVPLSKEHWITAPKVKLPNGLEVPYTQYVFTEWKPLQQKYLIGQLDFEEVNDSGHIWPIDQALDAVGQNSLSADRGGVICYEGAHRPCVPSQTADAELKNFAAAHATLMRYYESQHEKYLDAYASRQSTNSWKDLAGKGKYHRWIAMYLRNIGRIADLPVYCQDYAAPNALKAAKCDQCQQNVEDGAIICRHCARVLNPFLAFQKLMIDAETPGARLAAKRLTVEEIKLLAKKEIFSDDDLLSLGLTEKKTKAAQKTT